MSLVRAACAAAYAVALPVTAGTSSLVGIGDLEGGAVMSAAIAVSDDGLTVVGWSSSAAGDQEAVRWRMASGLEGLGDLPGGRFRSDATDVSADGSIVTGTGSSAAGTPAEAFRWTAAGGMIGLGDLAGGDFFSTGLAMTADGTVVVGGSITGACGYRPQRWIEDEGMEAFPAVCASPAASRAVSRDGATIGGGAAFSAFGSFVWREDTGLVTFPDLAGGIFLSAVSGLADGGDAASAYGNDDLGFRALRWDRAGGVTLLPSPPGGTVETVARSITGDGRFIAGHSSTGLDDGLSALLWDATDAVHVLDDLLRARCVDTAGWALARADDVVEVDGTLVLVGTGTNPAGDQEGFRAELELPLCVLGDLDCDGIVGTTDLLALLAAWGTGACPADLDGDGAVGTGDLLELLGRWTT